MKDFATIPNITGTFPSVTAKNSSGAGATDGTGLVADWVGQFFGAIQSALNRAGLSPSGVLEAWAAENAFAHGSPGEATIKSTANQVRTALQYLHGGPGELVLWSRSQAPATVGARILLLQGQTIAVASYPDLCNAVYCGDAANNTVGVPFYLSSDNGGVTRSTTGAYLTLPDARGVTIRGVDTGNTRDWGGSTRGGGTPNGSIQGFAMQGHYHTIIANSTGSTGVITPVASAHDGTQLTWAPASMVGITDGLTYEAKVNPAIQLASETRMINMATYIGIRY